MQLCSELPSNFIFNGEIDYTKLKSFGKIILFTINTKQLGYYNEEMQFVIEPGMADLMIGTSSEDIIYQTNIQLIGSPLNIIGNRTYSSQNKII